MPPNLTTNDHRQPAANEAHQSTTKGGDDEMQSMNPEFALQLARERMAGEIEAAAQRRRHGRPGQPFRRLLGRRIIRFGERLAAEPSLELARSR
jgi:hypothetical protein